MRVELKLHPDSVCDAVESIEVEVRRDSALLALSFSVSGDISRLVLPPRATPKRTDELWRHTCFEVFLCAPPAESYWESNFAPSMAWAVYRFDRYRSAMTHADELATGGIGETRSTNRYQITPTLVTAAVPVGTWRVGLTAVIEETRGRLSYWALRHPPGKPDFHHPDCFALELPPPSDT